VNVVGSGAGSMTVGWEGGKEKQSGPKRQVIPKGQSGEVGAGLKGLR